MENYDVDFVVLWVDSNDPIWQRKRAEYSCQDNDDISIIRYQNWDNIKYWFRAVEKYAPWVHKIHFVTCGQTPNWLNINHPQINLVCHADYMPNDALPVYNSSAIEVGLNNIPGLANHFVYFNDDMFLTAPVSQDYYFKNGIPFDMPGFISSPKKVYGNVFSAILFNNSAVLRKYFSKKDLLENRILEWLNPAMGKTCLRTFRYIFTNDFPGFVIPHLSVPYLKSDFEKVWEREDKTLRDTQYHRFRSEDDVTHFLFRNWRMCEGAYIPKKSTGKYFSVDNVAVANEIANSILNKKYPEICINESCTGEIFENVKEIVNSAFAQTLNNKCRFEK